MFIAFGLVGLWFGRNYAFGVVSRMGPGFFPLILSCGLICLGLAIGARGLVFVSPPIDKPHWRPLFFVCMSIATFGFFLESAGLIITTVVATILATFAFREQMPWYERIVLAAGLAIFAVLLFSFALKQPMPIWWNFQWN